MTVTEITSKRGKTADDRAAAVADAGILASLPRRRMRIIPFLITLAAVALAGALGWAMWDAYMGAPWTRDAPCAPMSSRWRRRLPAASSSCPSSTTDTFARAIC